MDSHGRGDNSYERESSFVFLECMRLNDVMRDNFVLYEGRSSQLYTQLLQLRKESLKNIQACTGFEP